MLEFEKIMEPLFSHGKKKRYVGRMVWPQEGAGGPRLRDPAHRRLRPAVGDADGGVRARCWTGTSEEAMKMARTPWRRRCRARCRSRSWSSPRAASRSTPTPTPTPRRRCRRREKLMAMGYEFVPGMKVSWIVTNSRQTPQEVEPWIEGRPFEGDPGLALLRGEGGADGVASDGGLWAGRAQPHRRQHPGQPVRRQLPERGPPSAPGPQGSEEDRQETDPGRLFLSVAEAADLGRFYIEPCYCAGNVTRRSVS